MVPVTPEAADAARRKERWMRIGLGIRLAYNAARPAVIRLWVCQGERLAADDLLDDIEMWSRVHRTLLHVAHDEALPMAWRAVALDHALRPTVRLAALLAGSDPLRATQVHAMLQAAHDRLDTAPASGPAGFHG
jgi:phage-related baseplate assembly protein